MLHQANPTASAGRIDWVAVLLEFAPFAALPVMFVAIETNNVFVLGAAIAASIASGLGWWRIGRPKAGVMVALARGIVFVYALGYGVTEQINELANAGDSAEGQSVIDIALMFYLLSTLASAVACGAFSRWVPVGVRAREEPA